MVSWRQRDSGRAMSRAPGIGSDTIREGTLSRWGVDRKSADPLQLWPGPEHPSSTLPPNEGVVLVRQMRLRGTLAGLACAVSVASAQQKATLSKPTAETTESFTNITAIRELPNGKVLLADRQDKVVQLIDFAGGSVTKVGREG